MSTRTKGPSSEHEEALRRQLRTWVKHGLISGTEADAVMAYETHPERTRPPSRTGPITEALAYLGAALAVAAAGILIGRIWDDLPLAARIAIPGALWLMLFGAGWALRDAGEPAMTRLHRVAWSLSPVALGWCVGVIAVDGFGATERWPLLWIGAAVAVYATTLYRLRPASAQQLPIVVGLAMIAAGTFEEAWAIGSAISSIGAAWIVLGAQRRLVDAGAALTIGTVASLVGVIWFPTPAAFWIGLAASAGLIGLSVAVRHGPMLALGAIGLFASTTATIQHFVRGSIGVAIGFLAAGLAIIGLAVAVSRLHPTRWRLRERST